MPNVSILSKLAFAIARLAIDDVRGCVLWGGGDGGSVMCHSVVGCKFGKSVRLYGRGTGHYT